VSFWEIAVLVMIFLGFLGLIIYVAKHARSGEEE
jgi:preprotein translocase subunit Sss1